MIGVLYRLHTWYDSGRIRKLWRFEHVKSRQPGASTSPITQFPEES